MTTLAARSRPSFGDGAAQRATLYYTMLQGAIPRDSQPFPRRLMTTGYSDRINHAFAFAAKHHDQQVRKGTRLPYLTRAPNVAVILTRYAQDEETVVAGILYDVVDDYVRDGCRPEMLEQRIASKFGDDVLRTLLAVIERRYDSDGTEMSHDERRDDLLHRIADADPHSRWVLAADQLHAGSALLADLRRTDFPESVWSRFASGREGTVRWYRRLCDALVHAGFDAPIMWEFRSMVEALEEPGLGTGDWGLGDDV